jgi:predicted amidohydrolase YtcJ
VILSNGKIITVDERFSIAQAVAIRGDRIVAVGSDAEVTKLASPATRRIDLRGRAVIPGLIDNHMHLTRARNDVAVGSAVGWRRVASRGARQTACARQGRRTR